jgi:hypothetical protein
VERIALAELKEARHVSALEPAIFRDVIEKWLCPSDFFEFRHDGFNQGGFIAGEGVKEAGRFRGHFSLYHFGAR